MPVIVQALRDGGVLARYPKLRDYYLRLADGSWGMGKLTASRVVRLEREGVLQLVGAETYALGEVPFEPPAPKRAAKPEKPKAPARATQLDLFGGA